MSVSEEPRPEELVAEAEGDSLGEAKWAAMKELEPRFPGITPSACSFEVLEEPADGRPARVAREVDVESLARRGRRRSPRSPPSGVRAVVARVVQALGLRATVDVDETDEEIRATVNGDDLGLLIGKHGATIDALQHLALRAALRGDASERKQVIVDAAGYRERREAALHRAADRAVADALRYDRPVELEPMRAPERKVVHTYLQRAHRRRDPQRGRRAGPPARRLADARLQRLRPSSLTVSRETLEGSRAPLRPAATAAAEQLERLLEALAAEPDPPTTVREPDAAADVHLADSLTGLEVPELRRAPRGSPTSAPAPASPAWRWRWRCRRRGST